MSRLSRRTASESPAGARCRATKSFRCAVNSLVGGRSFGRQGVMNEMVDLLDVRIKPITLAKSISGSRRFAVSPDEAGHASL